MITLLKHILWPQNRTTRALDSTLSVVRLVPFLYVDARLVILISVFECSFFNTFEFVFITCTNNSSVFFHRFLILVCRCKIDHIDQRVWMFLFQHSSIRFYYLYFQFFGLFSPFLVPICQCKIGHTAKL